MTKPENMRRCYLWPTDSDVALLEAALLPGRACVEAWQRWRRGVNYKDLDPAQHRLLPLLYENLRHHGVSKSTLQHYRNVFRFFWFKNRMLFAQARAELEALRGLGIEALVIKGLPLATMYYPHCGLRPMNDVDILVQRSDAARTINYLLSNGWSCANPSLRSLTRVDLLIEVRHGLNFHRKSGHRLDLHWEIARGCFAGTDTLWKDTQRIVSDGTVLRTLSSTGLLLHCFEQAVDWDHVRPIRWLADASFIVAKGDIDWQQLVTQAAHFELSEPVHLGLGVLRELMGLNIPPQAADELQHCRTSALAQMDFRLAARRPAPVIGKPLRRYLRYRRTRPDSGMSFARYLRQFWGVPTFGKVVLAGIDSIRRELKT